MEKTECILSIDTRLEGQADEFEHFEVAIPRRNAVLATLVRRFLVVTTNLITQRLVLGNQLRSISSLSDSEFLVRMTHVMLDSQPIRPDRRALQKLDARLAFRLLIANNGGVYSLKEAADYLAISEDAVRKRADKQRLLVIAEGDHKVYPTWQFDDNGVLPGFEQVLKNLPTSPTARCRFLLTPLITLNNLRRSKPYAKANSMPYWLKQDALTATACGESATTRTRLRQSSHPRLVGRRRCRATA